MKRSVVVVTTAVAITCVLGCGSSTRSSQGTSVGSSRGTAHVSVLASHTVGLGVGGYFVHPGQVTLSAGKANIEVSNRGPQEHELVILRTDSPANGLPVRGDRVLEHEAGKNYGEVDDLGPGQQRSLSVSLPPGRYVLICNLPGHYEKGMHAVLTVQ
jgi:uncharacterized cupredoxin-like copper-binding protein